MVGENHDTTDRKYTRKTIQGLADFKRGNVFKKYAAKEVPTRTTL